MKDPVTPELREAVLRRDGYQCIAPRIACRDPNHVYGPNGLCGDVDQCSGRATLDHVKDQPRMGKRAPSDIDHLVTLCEWHHLRSGWATAHRPELRAYLRRVAA